MELKEFEYKLENFDRITHGNPFHADDVFSEALIELYAEKQKLNIKRLFRTFKVPDDFQGIVFDIGKGEFDHHQEVETRENNKIPYASFGKLWRLLGKEFFDFNIEESFETIDSKIVCPIDLADNFGQQKAPNSLSYMISSFNEVNEKGSKNFFIAVNIAKQLLFQVIKSQNQRNEKEQIILSLVNQHKDDDYLVLKEFIPWGKSLINTNIKFVIFPSNRGGYNINLVYNDEGSYKIPLPEGWIENPPEDLNITFIHKTGFLIAVKDKDSAINTVKHILSIHNKNRI